MKWNGIWWFMWLAGLGLLLGGCTTAAVWEEGAFAHDPAIPADLRLFHSTQGKDILVEYNEFRGLHRRPRRRAYWLEANRERLEAGHPPRFVALGKADKLAPIPVFAPPIRYSTLPTNGLYAAVLANGFQFQLCSDEGGASSTFAAGGAETLQLPMYVGRWGRTEQVFLTPLAVVADASVVGGVIVGGIVYVCPYVLQGFTALNH